MIFRTADRFFALRFLRLLTTPWKKTGAYKAGIIDDKGRKLRKPVTGKQKNVYNLFHKLVFNLKRLLNKIPFGKSTLASYAAALWLIKEHTGLSDHLLAECLFENTGYNPYSDIEANKLNESFNIKFNGSGNYHLIESVMLQSGDMVNLQGLVNIKENAQPIGSVFGIPIFKGIHISTNQPIILTSQSLYKENAQDCTISERANTGV